jgi:hypothetical protein
MFCELSKSNYKLLLFLRQLMSSLLGSFELLWTWETEEEATSELGGVLVICLTN